MVALADFLGILVANVYVGRLYPSLEEAVVAASLIVGFFAVLTVIGGLLAVMRRAWTISIILAVIAIAFHLLGGGLLRTFLSITALVFIGMSKKEFD